MKIFWLNITKDKSNKKDKSIDVDKIKGIIDRSTWGAYWTRFLWSNITGCGNVNITLQSFYNLQKENNEALAYKNKIANMVWQKGMYLVDDNWNEYAEWKEVEFVRNTFKTPTFLNFKDMYFIQRFCSGEITIFPQKNALWEVKAQILDSRSVEKNFDKYWNLISITQWGNTNKYSNEDKKTYNLDEIYHNIILQDVNRYWYGMSAFNGIIMDALADAESAKRQLYFFINNAIPNALIMLDDAQFNSQDEIQNAIDMLKNQYGWSEKAHKTMISNGIKDIKLLEVTNKDLDLLNLRKFTIQKMAMVYQIDPRLIWFKEWSSWNNAEIIEIKKEASDTIRSYAQELEENMNAFYKKFVDKNFDKTIKIKSDTFQDDITIFEQSLKAVQYWCINRIEFRQRTGYSIDHAIWIGWKEAELPKDMQDFTIIGMVQKLTSLEDNPESEKTEREEEQTTNNE